MRMPRIKKRQQLHESKKKAKKHTLPGSYEESIEFLAMKVYRHIL